MTKVCSVAAFGAEFEARNTIADTQPDDSFLGAALIDDDDTVAVVRRLDILMEKIIKKLDPETFSILIQIKRNYCDFNFLAIF